MRASDEATRQDPEVRIDVDDDDVPLPELQQQGVQPRQSSGTLVAGRPPSDAHAQGLLHEHQEHARRAEAGVVGSGAGFLVNVGCATAEPTAAALAKGQPRGQAFPSRPLVPEQRARALALAMPRHVQVPSE